MSMSSSSDSAMRGGQQRQHRRHSSRERTASAGRDDDRRIKREHNNNNASTTTANRTGSTGRSARPTFPAPPPQAWGGNKKAVGGVKVNTDHGHQTDESNASTTNNTKNETAKVEEGRGWSKPDSNKPHGSYGSEAGGKKQGTAWPKPNNNTVPQKAAGSSSGQRTANSAAAKKSVPTGEVKGEDITKNTDPLRENSNPWAKTTATAVPNNDAKSTNNSAFPPWNAAEGGSNSDKKQPPFLPKTKTASLPSGSSWGKSQSSSSSTRAKPPNQKPKKTKGDEFPSLSTALKLPTRTHPSQRGKNPRMAVVTPTDEKMGKGKGSKKKGGAPATNHASFLSPPAGSSVKGSAKKKPPKQNSKQPGTSMAGAKRSAPSSVSTANNRGSSGDFFAAMDSSNKNNGAGLPVGGVKKKGRQRIGPRKKKLTTLKKRVLKERLRVWQERHGVAGDGNDVVTGEGQGSVKRLKVNGTAANAEETLLEGNESSSTTLSVQNFIQPEEDDLSDDDEHDEIVSNLIGLAGRVGRVLSVFVPRPGNGVEEREAKHVGSAFVRFASANDVSAARDILDGMVVGGRRIRTSVLTGEEMVPFDDDGAGGEAAAPSEENDRLWQFAVLKVTGDDGRVAMDEGGDVRTEDAPGARQPGALSTLAATIAFQKILCDDDYDDEEALEESIEDIKGLAQQYGHVEGARAATSGNDKGNVYITYGSLSAAEEAVGQLNGLVVGGSKIVVSINNDDDLQARKQTIGELVLNNVLNDDDFEDEDCLHESMEDIKNLAIKYGRIRNVDAAVSGEHKGRVTVSYLDGLEVARRAAQELNGMLVGGIAILASVSSSASEGGYGGAQIDESVSKSSPQPPPAPMYSGDKLVPEQFAACKRVPKLPPNPGVPRAYATKLADERALPTLLSMLSELMRLQVRSKDDKNARARRRLVMGLREVARGIRAHKVKMVVMANNLDEYGAIDSKLEEILELARAENLPVLFELNKRKLGKSLGKSIKVSVVGVQNADGAHEQFKKLKKMMGMA